MKRQLLNDQFHIRKIGILLLYLSITLEIIIVIVDKSNYTNPIEGQLFRVTFLLATGKILCTKYSIKEWAVLGLFGILGVVSYKATGRNEILRIVAFIGACKGTDVKKLLKYVFYTTMAGWRWRRILEGDIHRFDTALAWVIPMRCIVCL